MINDILKLIFKYSNWVTKYHLSNSNKFMKNTFIDFFKKSKDNDVIKINEYVRNNINYYIEEYNVNYDFYSYQIINKKIRFYNEFFEITIFYNDYCDSYHNEINIFDWMEVLYGEDTKFPQFKIVYNDLKIMDKYTVRFINDLLTEFHVKLIYSTTFSRNLK